MEHSTYQGLPNLIPRLLNKEELPEGFVYDATFLKFVSRGLINWHPWRVIFTELLKGRNADLKLRYPKWNLVPFAQRFDCDDIACFDGNNSGKVILINDFASEDYAFIGEFSNFTQFTTELLHTVIEWNE